VCITTIVDLFVFFYAVVAHTFHYVVRCVVNLHVEGGLAYVLHTIWCAIREQIHPSKYVSYRCRSWCWCHLLHDLERDLLATRLELIAESVPLISYGLCLATIARETDTWVIIVAVGPCIDFFQRVVIGGVDRKVSIHDVVLAIPTGF